MSHSTPSTSALSRKSYKRPYKKSTKGCTACKARKIKCDEVRPACGNCRKRYIGIDCCDYSSAVYQKSSSSSDSSRPSRQRNAGTLPLQKSVSVTPTGLGNSNILELRLMHHYTKLTCGQQLLKDMVPILSHPLWEIDIPQMAFSSDIVLNALLAISALNLLSLNPNDRTLALASRSYFDKALTKHRERVPHIESGNAEPLLVAAVLIAHHTWLSAHSSEGGERYGVPWETFCMCEGIAALVERTPTLSKYTWATRVLKDRSNDYVRHSNFLKSALEDMKLIMEAVDNEGFDPEDREAIKATTEEIIETYYLAAHGSVSFQQIEQASVTLLHRVPERFLGFLRKHHPIALAILARNLSVLALVMEDSKVWWIHGAGEWRVAIKAVWGIHGLMPSEWLWTMAWPMKIISKEIGLEKPNASEKLDKSPEKNETWLGPRMIQDTSILYLVQETR